MKQLDGDDLIKEYEKQKNDEAARLIIKKQTPVFHLGQLDMSLVKKKKTNTNA